MLLHFEKVLQSIDKVKTILLTTPFGKSGALLFLIEGLSTLSIVIILDIILSFFQVLTFLRLFLIQNSLRMMLESQS